MQRILFQGDSITDVSRNRENDHYMGMGYPTLVSAWLNYEYPQKYECINRGISGNRVVDLFARVRGDIILLKPDIMSILIGVNDVWHELTRSNGVSAEKYEAVYDMLIEEVKQALPDIQIMILEPFLLKGSATEEKWEIFRSEVEKRAASAKRISQKHGLSFVPLMEQFDMAARNTPDGYWILDGVHPSAAGHELIKREWLKAFADLKEDCKVPPL